MNHTKSFLFAASVVACSGIALTATAAESPALVESPAPPYRPWSLGIEAGTQGIFGTSASWRFADHMGLRAGADYSEFTWSHLGIGGTDYDARLRLLADSISIKSGRGMDGARTGKPSEDILISHCKLQCRTFACLGIGSETSGGVRHVRIEHCQLAAPRSYAIYVKTRIGRAGVTEGIFGDDLDISAGSFLRINLLSGGNTNTADDPVPGPLGIPEGKDFVFTNIRVNGGTLADVSQVSAEKPVQGLKLDHISGVCAKGISLQHVNQAVLRDIRVTGYSGPLLSINAVTGAGLDEAVPYSPSAAR